MDLKISERVAVVTGAGKGVGKACAYRLAKEKAAVAVCDIDEESGRETSRAINDAGGTSVFYRCNVSEEQDVKKVFADIFDHFGSIDILINNAGISPKLPYTEITAAQFKEVININLLSCFLCSKEAGEYMKDHHWGRIVNLSSLAGLHGGINSAAHYSSSKAGILGLTKTLAKQLGKYNITVNAVAPGRIDTAMTRMLSESQLKEVVSRIPLARLGTVEEVANVVVFLASEGGSYITGSCVEILGGYTG